MKKILVFVSAIIIMSAHATTVNINWLMDGQTYAQTTCQTGGNFALPSPTPTKYGYHFVGWQQNYVTGSWSQSGTPTPDNPIYPTFVTFGNTVLRALGTGENFVADTYDGATGKITRRVGVKVLDGTEDWLQSSTKGLFSSYELTNYDSIFFQNFIPYSTHFVGYLPVTPGVDMSNYGFRCGGVAAASETTRKTLYVKWNEIGEVSNFTDWLADQYSAGTPVTIYYPLAEPIEENYNAQ